MLKALANGSEFRFNVKIYSIQAYQTEIMRRDDEVWQQRKVLYFYLWATGENFRYSLFYEQLVNG